MIRLTHVFCNHELRSSQDHISSCALRYVDIKSGNPIPDENDPRKLTLVSSHQVAFWDETHPLVSERDAVDGMNGQLFNYLMVEK